MITQNHRGLLATAADADTTGSPGGGAGATTSGSAPSPETTGGGNAAGDDAEPDYEALLNENGTKFDPETKIPEGSVDLNAEIPTKGKADATTKTAPAAEAEAEDKPTDEETTPDEDDEDQPKVETNADGTPKKDANNFRVNLKDATDKDRKAAIIRLLKNEPGITMEEAARRVGVKSEPAAPDPKTAPASEAAPADDPRKGLRDEIARLQTESDTAADTEFDFAKARNLDKQIAAKQRELDQLEYQASQKTAVQNRTQAQKFESDVTDSWKGVAELFPDAVKDGSELQTALQSAINDKFKTNPGFFKDPDWPSALAVPFALKRGLAPKTSSAAPAPAAATAAKPTPKKSLAPVKPPAPAPGGASDGAATGWDPDKESIEQYLERNGTKLTAAG